MNYIGNVIKEYRGMMGMSRNDLSKNICSEKYVYLIEKGERTPSADLVRLFGDRLGVDLFDYYQYLDCINPIAVRENMKLLNMYRRKGDFAAVKEVADIAIDLPDFHRKPWIYEIEINRLSHMIFVQYRYQEAIADINRLMNSIDPKYSKDVIIANIYILLSTCCQLTGDLPSAKGAVFSAYEIICNKSKIEKHEQIITTVRISSMTMHYLSGEFDEVIREGNELIQYQSEMNSYERMHYTYFYLAFAYYKTGAYDEATAWFEKAIYSVMLDQKSMDVFYISAQDIFHVLLNDSRINRVIISEFKNKYNIS